MESDTRLTLSRGDARSLGLKPAPLDVVAEFERLHVRPRAGRTLIVGSHVYPGRSDRRARYPDCIGVDMQGGEGVDIVADLEQPQPALGLFAHIECCSVLEHTPRPWLLAETVQALLEPGGTLHISVPFVHRLHNYPQDLWRFTAESLPVLFPAITWGARMYASFVLQAGGKLPGLKSANGYPYSARCDVLAFGVKAA